MDFYLLDEGEITLQVGGELKSFSDITDINISDLQDDQFLQYNSTTGEWENKNLINITTVEWGNITGTLSNQTDLQNALNSKTDQTEFDSHISNATNPHETRLSNLQDYDADANVITNLEGINLNPNGTTSPSQGKLVYDSTNDVPAFYDEDLNRILLGDNLTHKGKNISGNEVTRGQVIYYTGATGENVNFDLAKADDPAKVKSLGIVFSDSINNNAVGRIVDAGRLSNLDTSGFVEGDTLYLSDTEAGNLTNIEPSYPNYSVKVGHVVRSHSTEGVIRVDIDDKTISTKAKEHIEDTTNPHNTSYSNISGSPSDDITAGDNLSWNNNTLNAVDTTYTSSDFDHNNLTNTHNLTTDIDHNSLTNYNANEHRDWENSITQNINDNNITSSSVTQHQADLSITESQISDLDHYTSSDFDTDFSGKSTTDLSEGNNLYFTDARADDRIALASIGDLSNIDLTGIADNKILKYNSTSGNFEIADDQDTTYTASDFNHDELSNVPVNDHLDWTTDQGGTYTIHPNNYTDTDTTYSAGSYLTLSSTTFSVNLGDGLEGDGSDNIQVKERINYETGHTAWADALSNEEIHRIALQTGETFVVERIEFRQKGGGSSTSASIDVYDSTGTTVIGSTNLGSTNKNPGSSGSGNTVLVRLNNSTGGSINASVRVVGYITGA